MQRHTTLGFYVQQAATIRAVQLARTAGRQAPLLRCGERPWHSREWLYWASGQAARCLINYTKTILATSAIGLFTPSDVAPHGTAFAKRCHVARAALWAAHRKPSACPEMAAHVCMHAGVSGRGCARAALKQRPSPYANAPLCARDRYGLRTPSGSPGGRAMIAVDSPPKQVFIYPPQVLQTPLPLVEKSPVSSRNLHSF